MKALDRDPAGIAGPAVSVLPGDHVCSVVDCTEQLADRMTAWVAEGFAAGERVVYVDVPDASRFLGWLEQAGVPWTQAMTEGRLVVLGPHDAYLTDGVFDVERCLAQHASFVEQAVAAGYPAVRMAAEATVALGVFPDLDSVLAYEQGFEELCRTLPLSGLCVYDRDDAEDRLDRFARAHPRAVSDDQFQGRVTDGRLCLSGELDVSNADLLASLLSHPVANDPVVVDVTELAFIDVAAAGVMVEAARRWAAHRVVLVGASPQLLTILRVSEWDEAFEFDAGSSDDDDHDQRAGS